MPARTRRGDRGKSGHAKPTHADVRSSPERVYGDRRVWKTACLILFLLSAAFVVPFALLGIGFNGSLPTNIGFWLVLVIALAPLYGWWRIKSMEVSAEDIERSR